MEFSTQEITLTCNLSSKNSLKKRKIGSYVIVTLFHGSTLKLEKHTAEIDAQGNANLQFKDVNVETDILRLQVFKHRKYLSNKHVGNVNVHMSELVHAEGQPSSLTYQLVTLAGGSKKGELKVSCKLSNPRKDLPAHVSSYEKLKLSEVESKRLPAAAIGNDIGLFKMLPSFRTPIVSLTWT